ncbi:MAG: leucine-rich repeat protein, partial [Clostridia bacterium]|nr:leucine-rich repeat protein [Clostridia bacterium]
VCVIISNYDEEDTTEITFEITYEGVDEPEDFGDVDGEGDYDDEDESSELTENGFYASILTETTCVIDGIDSEAINNGVLNIPETICGYTVTSIGGGAFMSQTSLTSVTIPDSVVEIGAWAFNGCTSLKSVSIPGGVSVLGERVFRGCSSLENVILQEGLTEIGWDAFAYCDSLTSVSIPGSVTSIDDSSFVGCSLLEAINVSAENRNYSSKDGVLFNKEETQLLQYPIAKKGTEYNIPGTVTSIERTAFYDCSSLEKITIPNSVTSIAYWSFMACSSLSEVNLPESLKTIGYEAFCNCTSLTSVTIPGSVTSIVDGAFGYYYEGGECKVEGFTVHGVKGTEAERYANDNGFIFVEVVSSHTHSYTESITKQPTCAETGTKTFTCTCGDSYTTPVAALGHNYSNEYTVDKSPTYDEEGSESRHCTRCGARTGEKAIPKLVRLFAPTILITTSTEKGVKFTWSAVEGADGYTVFKLVQDSTGNYVYKELATVGAATFAFTDWTAVEGETYCYAVCAMDNYGATSPYAEFAFTYVKPIPLATPTVKVANTAKGIKVSWNKVDNAQKYVVYRRFYSPTNKRWSGWVALKTTTGLSFTDTTTKIGINYRYTVKAVNGKSASAFKSTPTIKYNVVPTVTVANASNGIKVSWSTVANATGYTVYSSTYNSKTKKWSSWKNRGTAKANAKSWVDKSAKKGTIYKYTVRARYGSVASSFKASANIVRLLNPTVKVAKASNGIKVTWNKIAGAKNYKIYRAQYVNGKWSGWSAIKTTNNKTFAYVDKTAKKGVY